MRKATPEEIQSRTEWHVEITFKNPNKPKSKPQKQLGPFIGVIEAVARQVALDEAKLRWDYATDFEIIEIYDHLTSFGSDDPKNLFSWDWKTVRHVSGDDDEKFFKQLDEQLKPFGCEVVYIPFDGDMYPWFIGKRMYITT